MITRDASMKVGLTWYLAAVSAVPGCGAEPSTPVSTPAKAVAPHARKPQHSGDPTEITLARLREKPRWLFGSDECPADVESVAAVESDYRTEACTELPDACLDDCESGRGPACYALALRLQALKTDDDIVEPLFLRACRLGVMSGCTNRAAGILADEGDRRLACANRTFERMCVRDDPWACTMLGAHLIEGRGLSRDYDRALRVLAKSCKYGPDDPACSTALELIERVRFARQPSKP